MTILRNTYIKNTNTGEVSVGVIDTELLDSSLVGVSGYNITYASDEEINTFLLNNLKEELTSQTKQHAHTLITKQYPLYKQLNITRDYSKTSNEYKDMQEYINGIRDKCNEIQALMQSMNLEQLESFMVEDESNWV